MSDQQPAGVERASEETSGLAIAALVTGILGFMCVPAFIAIILGFIALVNIRSSSRLTGRGMAIAGIVLGFIWVGLGLLYIVVMVVLFAGAAGAQGM